MRSVLFMPANRPDFIAKVGERFTPDAVVLDLEDGTPASEKDRARTAAVDAARAIRQRFGGTVWVRVNQPGSPWFDHDLDAAVCDAVDGIVVPKVGSAEQVRDLDRSLVRLERASRIPPRRLMLGLETAAGVAHAVEILLAGAHTTAVYFGAEDYAADVGARRTPVGTEVLHARSHVVAAARAGGALALDQVVVDVRDGARFHSDAETGRDLGYDGKMLVHPGQIDAVHAVYTPSAAERDRAERLLAAWESARDDGRGTLEFEGGMVDDPLVAQARRVLDRAGA